MERISMNRIETRAARLRRERDLRIVEMARSILKDYEDVSEYAMHRHIGELVGVCWQTVRRACIAANVRPDYLMRKDAIACESHNNNA